MEMRVLLATGSSGGHIFPALALMRQLKQSGADVLMVLPKKENGVIFSAGKDEVLYIRASGLSLKLNAKNIKAAYSFLAGAWQSLKIVINFKPDVCVGFGSLETLALMFWSWLFRIKTMIHEQNVIPGKANCLMSGFVDKVAVSFTETAGYIKVSGLRLAVTGNPLRGEMSRVDRTKALEFFGLDAGKFNVLVTGGSQGSHKLNDVCSEALCACCGKSGLQVVHICGPQDSSRLRQVYQRAAIAHKVFEFLGDMQYAYSMADLAICRAGATTIAELRRFRVPALLVPYPFAYAHQSANARLLKDLGACIVVDDNDLDSGKLSGILEGLLEDPGKLEAMRMAYGEGEGDDAVVLLAREVFDLR